MAHNSEASELECMKFLTYMGIGMKYYHYLSPLGAEPVNFLTW